MTESGETDGDDGTPADTETDTETNVEEEVVARSIQPWFLDLSMSQRTLSGRRENFVFNHVAAS